VNSVVPELDTLHRWTNFEAQPALTLDPDTLHQQSQALKAADLRSRLAFPEAEMSQNKKPRQAQAAVSEKTAPQVLQARCAAWAHLRW
jgi:hypothetical protein